MERLISRLTGPVESLQCTWSVLLGRVNECYLTGHVWFIVRVDSWWRGGGVGGTERRDFYCPTHSPLLPLDRRSLFRHKCLYLSNPLLLQKSKMAGIIFTEKILSFRRLLKVSSALQASGWWTLSWAWWMARGKVKIEAFMAQNTGR